MNKELTRDDCEGALECLLNMSWEDCINGDVFEELTKDAKECLEQLINEHFKLKEKYKRLKKNYWEDAEFYRNYHDWL